MNETPAGLCDRCSQAREIRSARGSRFVLCERSTTDPAFPRYPRLPVVACTGFEAAAIDERSEGGGPLDAARGTRLSSADITKNGL